MKRKDKYSHIRTNGCAACGDKFNDISIDHIKTRGAGGTEEEWNLMPLCFVCHVKKGKIGIMKMCDKYPSYKNWLIDNGWSFSYGKWRH